MTSATCHVEETGRLCAVVLIGCLPIAPRNLGRTPIDNYRFLHCSVDHVTNRVLKDGYSHGDNMTINKCASDCQEFMYFGLEYGRECFCANEYTVQEQRPLEECFMECSGDTSQLCGAGDRLAVYTSIPLTHDPEPEPEPEAVV